MEKFSGAESHLHIRRRDRRRRRLQEFPSQFCRRIVLPARIESNKPQA